MENVTCLKCNTLVNYLDIFPGSLCPDCYQEKMDKVPLDELEKPDFVNCINL